MIRTRIAPSPTGEDLHIGNLYTALINWVFARKNKGKFIVRIEDTDRQRLVLGAEKQIIKTLKDYGLEADEDPKKGGPYSPYRQSERLAIYQKYAHLLVEKGFAYYCICSKEKLEKLRKEQQAKKQIPKYDGYCRNLNLSDTDLEKKKIPYVIRLKIPKDKKIIIKDLIRGQIIFNSNDLDDQVILKSDGYPTYHLAVVIDDHLMQVSHVIRAEEWLPSTPKHVLLYQAFGWPLPIFCHLPILRNPDRSKLSKRKNPVWASWYLKEGFLPKAVLNYLALMGWSHPKQKEVFDLKEFIEVFDLKDVDVVGPAFDPVKLEWLNGEWIRRTQNSNLKTLIVEYYKKYQNKNLDSNLVEKTIPLVKERMKKLSDYWFYCQFFFEEPNIDVSLIKDTSYIKSIYKVLEKIEDWTAQNIGQSMQELVKKIGLKTGDFFMTLRILITGKKISPPLNESMEILGKKKCLERIKKMIKN